MSVDSHKCIEAETKEHAVVLSDVRKRFAGKVVHDGVSLSVRPGELMTLVGGSGQGKTVLLKEVIGLAQPDSGEVYVHGREVTRMSEEELLTIRSEVAMVFQGSALFDSLTVAQNVAYGLRERRRDLPNAELMAVVKEKLELVDMPGIEDLMPAELSGGMQKRVAFARALALEPRVILYDEPTTGLDPANVRRVNGLMAKLRDVMNVTGIMVTHDMASVEAITDRVALLENGKILAVGTWAEMENSEIEHVRQFLEGDFGE